MNHYILALEQDYQKLANLYTSMLDAGVYDSNPESGRQLEQRLRNLRTRICEETAIAQAEF